MKRTARSSGKKVLLIGTNDLILGGVQRLVIDQLRYADRASFDVHLAVLMEFPGKATFDALIPDDVTVHRIGFSGFRDVSAWMRLLGLLARLRPDAVKTATFFSNTVFLLLKPWFGYAVIAAEHNTLNRKPFWQRQVDRLLFPFASTVLADSKEVVEFVSKAESIPSDRFTVLYNGVDLGAVARAEAQYGSRREAIRAGLGVPADAHLVLSVGRLTEQKNHQLMIAAFARLCEGERGAYLVIAGGGKREGLIAEDINARGLGDRVRLLGERTEVAELYAAADSFLLTSHHEGFCIAAMEGLAYGLPLISTRVAGVSEYLEDGVNGYFIDYDAGDAARRLAQVIAFSPGERKSFSEAARRTAQSYSTDRYGREFNRIVKDSLFRRGESPRILRRIAWGALHALARIIPHAPRMTVLVYHSISDGGDPFSVAPADFRKQMGYVRRSSDPVPLARAFAHAGGDRVRRDSVAVTFDDGYQDFLTNALPVLNECGIPATVFLLRDDADRKELGNDLPLLSREEVGLLSRDPLVTLGSHGLTHRKLTRMPDADALEELSESMRLIAEQGGASPAYVAYPKGAHNAQVRGAAEEAGYAGGVSVIERSVRKGDDAFALPRVQVDSRTSFREFRARLTPAVDWYYSLWSLIRGRS